MAERIISVFDVARRARVSQKTVSRAFSGKGSIGVDTRDRIFQVAKEMGYRPNALVSGLRGGQTRSIAVMWDFYGGNRVTALDILQRWQKAGRATFQVQHGDAPVDTDVLDDLIQRRIDALVIQSTDEHLMRPEVTARLAKLPAVIAVVPQRVVNLRGDQVVSDRNHAIRQVVDYFAATGRKRPAFVTDLTYHSNQIKYRAFLDCCRVHGLADHPHTLIPYRAEPQPNIKESQSNVHVYWQAMEQAFPDRVEVDAIFCFDDVAAMTACRFLEKRGVRVPEDVALVGFDDSDAAELWKPPLASGHRCGEQVTEAVDELLRRRLEDPRLELQTRVVPMQFLWRESAGPAREMQA